MNKIMKRIAALWLACLMVFGSFSVVGSAKGNDSETIAPVEEGNGTVTYGLDIYKDGTKLSDGDTLSPGDVVDVQICFGTDFYVGLLSSEIYYDSTYFEPYLDGAVYTDSPVNTFKEESSFIQILESESTPKAETKDGDSVTFFRTIAPIDDNGYSGLVNKADVASAWKQWTPLAWRALTKDNGATTVSTPNAQCDILAEYQKYHFVGLSLTCNGKNSLGGKLVQIPYAPYFSFQLRIKDGADTAGAAAASIFVPIDGAKRSNAQTCNRLYATNCPTGMYTSKSVPMNGQGYDLTAADVDFVISAAAAPHTHSFTNYVSDGNATCTADGTKTAKCDYCDATDTIADEGSALGHSFTNYVPDGNATCRADGTKTAKCDRCDAKDTIKDVGSRLAHSYAISRWIWASDYKNASAIFLCSKCGNDQTRFTAAIDETVITPAGCTTDQVVTYTATLEFEGKSYSTTTNQITLEGTATGHTYGAPTWEWAEDYSSATATFACTAGDDEQTLTDNAPAETVVAAANCSNDKVSTFTAEVEFMGENYSETAESVSVPGTRNDTHIWSTNVERIDDNDHGIKCTLCEVVKEDSRQAHSFTIEAGIVKEATLTESGVKTMECSVCGAQKDVEYTLDHMHEYGEPVWAWAADYSSVTAKFTCICGDTQTVTATEIDTETLTEEACGQDRIVQYVASVEFDGEPYETTSDPVTIEGTALTHSFTNYVSNGDATCTADGTKTAKCDNGCGAKDTIADEGSALGHSFTNYVSDGNATCKADGTKTAKCDRCDAKDTITDEGSRLDHSYAVSAWNWAADYSSASAKFVCGGCSDEQTVNAANITTTVVSAVSCTEKGVEKYTATVEFNGTSYADTTDEITVADALGHAYNAVVTAPTATSGGYTTYTCTRCGDTYTDDYTDPLPATTYTVTPVSYTPAVDEGDEEEYTSRGYALEGGTVTGGGTYDEGASVTLTAMPNAYYKFIGWYDGDTLVSADTAYTFTVTGNVTLTAKFVKNGDVNGDGYVDAGDATLILRHVVAGTPEQDPLMRQPWQLTVADVNQSYDPADPDYPLEDEVDAGDATLILRFLVDPGRTLPC